MQSLGCVLAATVRGARGSRVPLIIGLSCTRRSRRRRATEPHFHAPEWAARPMTTDKDEAAGSSPARPTIPGLTCAHASPLSLAIAAAPGASPAHSGLRTHPCSWSVSSWISMISPASMVSTCHCWGVSARRRTTETRRRQRPTTALGRCPARPPASPGAGPRPPRSRTAAGSAWG
jgi:hypothetical protein